MDRFFLWLILLDWVVSWEVEEEGGRHIARSFLFWERGKVRG
jgi:hypothetical protein